MTTKKKKRLSTFAIWASILGFVVGVIALVVAIILSSSSAKQIDKVNTKLVNYDPLTRDKVLQEKEKMLVDQGTLLAEKEKKIKELKKALDESCASTEQERQEAQAEIAKGNMGRARELFDRSIARKCGFLAEDYYQLGNAYFVDKKPDYRAALAAYREADRLSPGNAEYLNMIGLVYRVLGQYGQAKDYLEKTLAIREKVLAADHPDLATSYNNLCTIYYAMGQLDQARDYGQRAVAILAKLFPNGHPNLDIMRQNLAGIEARAGKKKK